MDEVGVRRIVFSSSATVYGVPEYLPLDEKHRTGISTNMYYNQCDHYIKIEKVITTYM